jgi:signal transduction histidine kinase
VDPRHVRLLRLALWPAGFLFGLGAFVAMGRFGDRTDAQLVSDLLGGWAFMVAGLVAWERLPDRRIGPIAVLIGFTWFVGSYGPSGSTLVRYLATSFQGFFAPCMAWLAIAYPTGRVGPGAGRVVLVAWFATLAAWTVARLALGVPLAWYPCPGCEASVEAWTWTQQLLDTISLPVGLGASLCAAGTVIVLARRIRSATPVGRRRLAPVALAAIVIGLGLVVVDAERALGEGALSTRMTAPVLNALSILLAAAVLAGLLAEQSTRSAVADVVGALEASTADRKAGHGAVASPASLESALRAALGDASLRLLAWDPAVGTYRDTAGTPCVRPAEDDQLAVLSLGDGEPPPGLLVLDGALRDDPGLAASVRAAVRLHTENARLWEEVRRQLDDVRASRARLVEAGDTERRRLERDLHDGAQQRLVALALDLQRVRTLLPADAAPGLRQALDDAASDAGLAIEELRELARGIHPSVLAEGGLGAAIDGLAARSRIPVTIDDTLAGQRFEPSIEATAYFVVAEGLTNAAKASGASGIKVRTGRRNGLLEVEVADDGAGGADASRGTGLRGLDDRVTAIGGRLHVDSVPGSGTRLRAELPVGGADG